MRVASRMVLRETPREAARGTSWSGIPGRSSPFKIRWRRIGRDLIRNTDPVNLRALHENVDRERDAKSGVILLRRCSRCQVLNNSAALCQSNSHRVALAVIRRPEYLRRRTGP